MLDTCTLTVLALMNSCLPISPLLRPCGDQREDLPLARGERVVRTVAVGCVAARSRPSVRSSASSGSARRRSAVARADVRRGRAPAGSPAARRTAASRACDRACSKTCPNVSNASTASSQAATSSSSPGRVDAGQPAQPSVLGSAAGAIQACPSGPITFQRRSPRASGLRRRPRASSPPRHVIAARSSAERRPRPSRAGRSAAR